MLCAPHMKLYLPSLYPVGRRNSSDKTPACKRQSICMSRVGKHMIFLEVRWWSLVWKQRPQEQQEMILLISLWIEYRCQWIIQLQESFCSYCFDLGLDDFRFRHWECCSRTVWCGTSSHREEHIVARGIETHVQALNYSRQLHQCFKGNDPAALFRPYSGTAGSHSQFFLLYIHHQHR